MIFKLFIVNFVKYNPLLSIYIAFLMIFSKLYILILHIFSNCNYCLQLWCNSTSNSKRSWKNYLPKSCPRPRFSIKIPIFMRCIFIYLTLTLGVSNFCLLSFVQDRFLFGIMFYFSFQYPKLNTIFQHLKAR